MAEFSKQYCEIYEPDLNWDFDIDEVVMEIPKGHFKSIICEGFGFVGIGHRMDNTICLLFDDSDGSIKQVDYLQYIQKHKTKSLGI